jgi:hypothetical protein
MQDFEWATRTFIVVSILFLWFLGVLLNFWFLRGERRLNKNEQDFSFLWMVIQLTPLGTFVNLIRARKIGVKKTLIVGMYERS